MIKKVLVVGGAGYIQHHLKLPQIVIYQ